MIHKKQKLFKTKLYIVLTVILFALSGLSQIYALDTPLENIYSTPFNSTVKLDDKDWIVVRKQTIGSDNYVMLVTFYAPNSWMAFNSSLSPINNKYQNSELRGRVTDYYLYDTGPALKNVAVKPNMYGPPYPTPGASRGTITEATATPASTVPGGADIMFALSIQDMRDWEALGANTFWSRHPLNSHWLTRTEGDNDTYIWQALKTDAANGTFSGTLGAYGNSNTLEFYGVWIKCSPDRFTLTYNGNGNTGGTAPAGGDYDANANVPVSGPGDLSQTCYRFMGWAWTPSATDPVYIYDGTSFSPSSFTITRDTTLYAVWRDATSLIWTPGANAGGDKQNWNNPANWTPQAVPMSCSNVYIPGNSSHYPVLTPSEKGVCKDIYFIQGAELGRPDLLTYEKAYVQYNFGLWQTNQINDQDNTSLVLTNTSTVKRMQYSASVSDPLDRERWYLLSSPLRGVVTGDLSFGGFPLTFLKKFDPVKRAGQNYSVGNWTTPYTGTTEPVVSPSSVTSGFAFFMYGYGSSGNAARNLGCEESGYFSNPAYKDPTFFPFRSGEYYGIKETNGILELPFFADSTSLFAHRTQVYNQPAANYSSFYSVYDGSGGSTVNSLSGEKETIGREANNGNYRFAPENYNSGSGKWEFQPQINHPVSGLSDRVEFLAGNPYMSSIDMVRFCEDNEFSVDPSYRIWNGDDYDDYSIDVSSGVVTPTNPKNTSRYIAPLQGFILTYTGTGDVLFDVTHISTVRPTESASNLRSAGEAGEENTLRIKAENSVAASYSVIKYREGAGNAFMRGKDVQKLFSPNDYVPEIYALAGEIPASIRFINNNGEIIVPIGVKTNRTGDIQLTVSGMNNYSKASKIELIDALENRVINLTGMPDYTYIYNNTETGIQNGRFSLRIGNSMTALPEVNSPDEIKVYGDSKGIYVITSSSDPVQKLEIYDLQGRKRYESASGASYYPVPDNVGKSPVIIKVITANGVTSYKLQLKVES